MAPLSLRDLRHKPLHAKPADTLEKLLKGAAIVEEPPPEPSADEAVVPSGAAPDAETDAMPPAVVALVGAAPIELETQVPDGLGMYELRPGREVNGAPSYHFCNKRGADLILWRTSDDVEEPAWIVGKLTEVGGLRGSMRARDGALRPDKVTAAWEMLRGESSWMETWEILFRWFGLF